MKIVSYFDKQCCQKQQMQTPHSLAHSLSCTVLKAWCEYFMVKVCLPLRLTEPFNFCSGIWPVVFMRFYWEMELMISSISTKKKKIESYWFQTTIMTFHVFLEKCFLSKVGKKKKKERKKGFPIKCLTGWYHPILQNVENLPPTWPDEGWSSPWAVWGLPDVAAWPDRSLLVPACPGVIVKKSGFHIQAGPLLPLPPATCLWVSIHRSCLKDLSPQAPLKCPEDLDEVSGDAFPSMFPFVWKAILRFSENQNPSCCDVQHFLLSSGS